jgi:hypothetical protein
MPGVSVDGKTDGMDDAGRSTRIVRQQLRRYNEVRNFVRVDNRVGVSRLLLSAVVSREEHRMFEKRHF